MLHYGHQQNVNLVVLEFSATLVVWNQVNRAICWKADETSETTSNSKAKAEPMNDNCVSDLTPITLDIVLF